MAWDAPSIVHLIALYGYPVLFLFVFVASAGAPLPVSIVLAALGALSVERGGPNVLALALTAALASFGGDSLDYGLARFGGPRVARWIQRVLRRHGDLLPDQRFASTTRQAMMIFLSRFALTPLAVPANLLAGATRFGYARFFALDVAGKSLYVVGNLLLGRLFGVGLVAGGPLPIVLYTVGVVGITLPFLLNRRWARARPPRATSAAAPPADATTPPEEIPPQERRSQPIAPRA